MPRKKDPAGVNPASLDDPRIGFLRAKLGHSLAHVLHDQRHQDCAERGIGKAELGYILDLLTAQGGATVEPLVGGALVAGGGK